MHIAVRVHRSNSRVHMQEHGKRTAALIGKTAATLIAIHREAFKNMLASGAPSPGADVARA